MLDDSSTSLYLAKKLKEKKNLTVITNSVELVVELSDVEAVSYTHLFSDVLPTLQIRIFIVRSLLFSIL